jgi:CRISPR/Cas system CSM-associated protein Csm2 small subunit
MSKNFIKNHNQRNDTRGSFQEEIDKKIEKFKELESYLTLHVSPAEKEINTLKNFFKTNNEDVSASQLRNLFDEVKRSSIDNIALVKIKLAYMASRTEPGKKGYHAFIALYSQLINKALELHEKSEDKKIDYHKGLVTFLEASIAYQKYFYKLKNNAYEL